VGNLKLSAAAALRWAVVWGPFFVLWVIFYRGWSRIGIPQAMILAAVAIGSAAVLSIPVGRVSGYVPWRGRPTLWFCAAHCVFASAYAATWLLVIYGFDGWRLGVSPLGLMARSRVLGWQIMMGLWLYGLIAGLAYARHAFEHAAAEERRALTANTLAAEAKLEALRARLQPHFLFNALHALHALVRENPSAAETGIERLGELLRYTLHHDARALVPLGDEWRFTTEYLKFERLRFGDRLNVSQAMEPGIDEWPVPPFALQTLVENAVQHAIALARGGHISLAAHRDGDHLRLVVRDSGADRSTTSQATQASGLSTLRARLAAIYEDRWQLGIVEGPDGWEVTLVLPPGDHLEED
jgi:sensor histidine kinase YesM